MLKLKNVSKFYYSNGVVTSGFTKVNLDLKRGEFVAITGESGSGKSTLLNVISGLDSYEEGEMYINGEETSAYSNADFENYRRKYIANIYQSFNLINSYTVYQNVDMALLLSGVKRRERRARIIDVLKKVDLYKFRNTKASRLSGGQKQRVAIARALVKDTPIIVADEPTGNLDSASAANVIELLSQLASDRLVVVVTHNYEQIEPYVTRKITMHDGRVTEDLIIRKAGLEGGDDEDAPKNTETMELQDRKRHHLKFFPRHRLGIRNSFNIVPKFLLLLFIFFFVSAAVTSLYANMRSSDYISSNNGYNYYFSNTSDKRIIVKKADGSPITADDYEEIKKLPNVDYIFEDDILLDGEISLQCDSSNDEWYYFYGFMVGLDSVKEEDLSWGRLPENDNEVVCIGPKDHYYNSEEIVQSIFDQKFDLYVDGMGDGKSTASVKVCGFVFRESNNWNFSIACPEALFESVGETINGNYSTMTVTVAGQTFRSERWSMYNKVVPSKKVAKGYALVSSDWNGMFDYYWAPGNTFTVKVSNLYYEDSKRFTIGDVYYSWDFTDKTGYDYYDYNNGVILINEDDYRSFFNKDSYQSSVFIKDYEKAEETVGDLKELGYEPLYVKNALMSYSGTWEIVDRIFNTLWSSALVIVLFFVSYFIIKLIMKSRNVYFATIRMLGASAADCRSLIIIDLLLVMNIAFIAMLGAIYAAYCGYYTLDFVSTILNFLKLKDYVVLYGVLVFMSLLIALRYARKLFKTSAMNVYKEV